MTVIRRDSLGQPVPQVPPPAASAPLDATGGDQNSGTARGDSLTAAYRQGFDLSSDAGENTGSGIGVGNADNFRTAPGPTDAGPGVALGQRDPLTIKPGGDTGTDGGGRAVL